MKKIIIAILLLSLSSWTSLLHAKEKQITFAMEATYPPFESIDENGNIVGFDIAIGQEICQKIRAKCSFINAPWDSLIPGLKLGKYDALISAIAITPERAKQVIFSQPYYFDTASFVSKKGQSLTISLSGLKGKRIGVQGGTSMENYMRNTYQQADVNILSYASIADAFLDLRSGRLHAVLADTPIANAWIEKLASVDVQVESQLVTNAAFFGSGLGIAVSKDNPALLQEINKALHDIKAEGTYDKMIAIYFGTSQ